MIAEAQGNFVEFEHLDRIRSLVNAIKTRDLPLKKMAGHRFVGSQHKLFNDAMGDIALGFDNANHATKLIEGNDRLR